MPCSPQTPQFRIAVDVSQANAIDDPSSLVMQVAQEKGHGIRPRSLELVLGPKEFRLLADCLLGSSQKIPVRIETLGTKSVEYIPVEFYDWYPSMADLAAELANLNTKVRVTVTGLARG